MLVEGEKEQEQREGALLDGRDQPLGGFVRSLRFAFMRSRRSKKRNRRGGKRRKEEK